jgi:hypothetical protein
VSRFELAQAAATLGDPPVDRGVRDAEQRGNLVVAEPERLQIEGLAILRLDQPQIAEPTRVKHAVGDLVGEVTVIAHGLAQLPGLGAVGIRRTERPAGVSTRSRR